MSLFLGWMAAGVWGGAAALAVGLLTALLGRLRAPGRQLALLWLAVGLRFLCPFGVRLSLPGQAGLPLAALAHAAAGGDTASAAGPGPAPAAAQTAPQPTAGPGSAATAGSASLPAADAQPPVSLSAETLAALQESVAQYLADAAATGVPAARTADAPQASARTAPLEALANRAAALLPFRAGASFAPPLAAYSRISRSFQTGGHLGTDFAADAGTPVLAVQGGVVLLAQYNGSYGNCVIVYHGVGADGSPLVTLYAHLDSLAVTAGAPVAQGGQPGTVGATGNSTGPPPASGGLGGRAAHGPANPAVPAGLTRGPPHGAAFGAEPAVAPQNIRFFVLPFHFCPARAILLHKVWRSARKGRHPGGKAWITSTARSWIFYS